MVRPLNALVGVPFRDRGRDLSGLDCWGCVWFVYKHELGVDLPAWDTVSYKQGFEVDELIKSERQRPEWLPIDLANARQFDVVEMNGRFHNGLGGFNIGRIHCGLITDGIAEKRVLHCERASGVVSVPLKSLLIREPRIYRHRSQLDNRHGPPKAA